MQDIVCFTTNLDQFDEYEFEEMPFPKNSAPSEFNVSSQGTFYKQLSIIDGQTTYILYGLGEFTEAQKNKLREDWQRYCPPA